MQVSDQAGDLKNIQWHLDKIKDVTEDQKQIALALEKWEEMRLASISDDKLSNSSEYL